jgi:hypothetical protein
MKKHVLNFYTTFVWSTSHSSKNSARFCHKCAYVGLHAKYPSFLSGIHEVLIFSTGFWKNTQILNFTNVCPVGADCCMRTDRHTDWHAEEHDEVNCRFSQFCERAEKLLLLLRKHCHQDVRYIGSLALHAPNRRMSLPFYPLGKCPTAPVV